MSALLTYYLIIGPVPLAKRAAARNMTVNTSGMIKSIKRNGVIVASIRRDKPTRTERVRALSYRIINFDPAAKRSLTCVSTLRIRNSERKEKYG